MTMTDPRLSHFNKEYRLSPLLEKGELPQDLELWFPSSCQKVEFSPRFSQLCDELNGVKSLLNRVPLDRWHQHTRAQNPAGAIVPRIRSIFRPELLTQAWCKFTECLVKYDLVSDAGAPLASVHLCEAPGAFIAALNHHLAARGVPKSQWRWAATTLNPYYEGNSCSSMINDDRFIFHTLDGWHFGDDGTGDILEDANRLSLARSLREAIKGQGANLVTADGSIDCQGDPARQEAIVGPLHLAEASLAISLLAPGGHFVIKMFTFFETTSVYLLYLLATTFDSVTVHKPVTSKEGNSEVYVVCKGFKNNLSESQKVKLLQRASSGDCLFPREVIPGSFIADVLQCVEVFKDIQCSVIKKNLASFESPQADDECIKDLRHFVAEEYVKRNGICRINKNRLLVPGGLKSVRLCWQLDAREEEGTFEDRVKKQNEQTNLCRLKERLLAARLQGFRFEPYAHWCNAPAVHEGQLVFKYGRAISVIKSSKFCPSKLIDLYRESLDMSAAASQAKRKKRRKVEEVNDELMAKLLSVYPDLEKNIVSFSFVHHTLIQTNLKNLVDDLRRLLVCLEDVSRGSHLILRNFACLTRLCVGVLVLISRGFEEIGFVHSRGNSDAIVLSEFKGDLSSTHQLLSQVIEAIETEHDNKQLLEILPLDVIVPESFYSLLVAHNFLSLKEKSLSHLSECEANEVILQ